jgi:hypothetical protein
MSSIGSLPPSDPKVLQFPDTTSEPASRKRKAEQAEAAPSSKTAKITQVTEEDTPERLLQRLKTSRTATALLAEAQASQKKLGLPPVSLRFVPELEIDKERKVGTVGYCVHATGVIYIHKDVESDLKLNALVFELINILGTPEYQELLKARMFLTPEMFAIIAEHIEYQRVQQFPAIMQKCLAEGWNQRVYTCRTYEFADFKHYLQTQIGSGHTQIYMRGQQEYIQANSQEIVKKLLFFLIDKLL